MKKRIIIISILSVLIIGCFVVFNYTRNNFNLANNEGAVNELDSTMVDSLDFANELDSIADLDSLDLVIIDSVEVKEVSKPKKEIDKSKYWINKTNYYLKKKKLSKAQYSFRKLKKYCKDDEVISDFEDKIQSLKDSKPSVSLDNEVDSWELLKESGDDTTFYIIYNRVTGTKLSNRYYTKDKAEAELKSFKKILSR